MVFFTGTLQEGIQTALQQSKLVVCFVTDDQEESKTWETEYLTDDSVAPSLEKDAVVLRLEAGSQEAGYLAAIFPLPKTPTLVIIKNGELKEYVAAGTAKDELLRRVGRAFSAEVASSQGQAGASTTAPVAQTAAPAAEASSATTTPPPGPAAQAPASTTSSATTLLTEAERRREAARREREEMERERRRKDKGKLPADDDPAKAKQSDAVKKASQQLAERQRQAREERARVLRLIEDDKAERRARQERERQERNAANNGDGIDGDSATAAPLSVPDGVAPSSPVGRRHDQCAIQVRLFDGSTIRTRFPATATLARDVRQWVDEARTDDGGRRAPYTFKVILTPQPNRAIDHAAEEERSLEDLGLAPSATLVLTPVDRYSSSYTNVNAGLTNPVSRLITAVLAFVMNILGGVAGALGGLGGSGVRADGGGADAAPRRGGASGTAGQDGNPQSSSATQATGRDSNGRIKGFQNPDDSKKDYQLYNGNSVSSSPPFKLKCCGDRGADISQLNFEPRKDDDDKDK